MKMYIRIMLYKAGVGILWVVIGMQKSYSFQLHADLYALQSSEVKLG